MTQDSSPESIYRIFIHGGSVFEGSIAEFEKHWFVRPENYSLEKFIQFIKRWSEAQGWTFKITYLH